MKKIFLFLIIFQLTKCPPVQEVVAILNKNDFKIYVYFKEKSDILMPFKKFELKPNDFGLFCFDETQYKFSVVSDRIDKDGKAAIYIGIFSESVNNKLIIVDSNEISSYKMETLTDQLLNELIPLVKHISSN